MLNTRGTPFVPGRARGVLCHDPVCPERLAAVVLVLGQEQLADLVRRLAAGGPRPAGLVVAGAAPLSHPMIRLLGLGLPTLIVDPAAAAALPDGTEVALDGAHGTLCDARLPQAREPFGSAPAQGKAAGEALVTADGEPVALRASVADDAGAAAARRWGAQSVGLVRSEFLYPADGTPPDRVFLEQALGAVCEAAAPLPVTVRLLDIAADKRPPWCPPIPGLEGPLGLHGARLYGLEPVASVVNAQVQAAGRLARRFTLALLLPEMGRIDAFLAWRRQHEAWLPARIQVGALVETPAAALNVGQWLQRADFVAVGCNDLMQALFGADRDIPAVGSLLDPYAPVVYRFLHQVAQVAGGATPRLQLCGVLPQVPGVLPLLLGLGFRTFSVEPRLLAHLAEVVAQSNATAARARVREVRGLSDADQVRRRLGFAPGKSWPQGAVAGSLNEH